MIEIKNIRKQFGDVQAIHDMSADIREGAVFGLVGTNGAGKSTFLRIVSGILKPDTGEVLIDGTPVYENRVAKEKLFFISDDQYYFPNASAKDMMEYYAMIYQDFDKRKFKEYLEKFGLDMERKINTFSKGMKRQVSVLLGICANTKYLLCDETFDGLDPVMRQAVKSMFVSEIMGRDFTPVIASHNLRELEDICDHVGLLHQGGILFSRDLEEMKCMIHKVQCVIPVTADEEQLLKELDVLQCIRSGSLLTITARGSKCEILERVERKNPLFCEILPLTLEEIFISETEVAGYDIKNLIF
ncbi:ABC transporter ATP-binding protein [Ruminococcus sp. OA3]|uniref:ABC transporter ATP-binding protein n=1 Tax=Ruminococcus sp. OA3 TaxID=2914164 RepID=UPI001F0677B3|nr:ABC transporter ATP-binding protein [Ruminococcus sp. OA3]MCH1982874.1 ABC transporter ATP-binding protein [Ruminococcus sp. OA3]